MKPSVTIFRDIIDGIRDDEDGPQIDIAKDVLPNSMIRSSSPITRHQTLVRTHAGGGQNQRAKQLKRLFASDGG